MIKEPGLTALRISYVVIRTPLALLNEQVVARAFGADSTAHRSLAHGLQTIDALAAQAFAGCTGESVDDEVPTPSREPAASAPATAHRPKPAAAPEPPEPAADRADETIDQDEQQEISDLADRYLEQEQLENRAGELADNDEVRRVQAEIRAKQAIEDEHGQL